MRNALYYHLPQFVRDLLKMKLIRRTPCKNRERLEDVKTFSYLGSIKTISGDTDEDITLKITLVRYVFAILKPVWTPTI